MASHSATVLYAGVPECEIDELVEGLRLSRYVSLVGWSSISNVEGTFGRKRVNLTKRRWRALFALLEPGHVSIRRFTCDA